MKYRLLIAIILLVWLISGLLMPLVPPAQADELDWSFISPDLDGDGLPNEVEELGWCNGVGCFYTNPLDPDADDDGLTDGEEKLFDSQPNNAASPGIYVIYENDFKTKEYYPWQQYGHKLIARGDAVGHSFNAPNPDEVDTRRGKPHNLDAVVVRRGTTFYVGGALDAELEIEKSIGSLSNLEKSRDPYSGHWRVRVPGNGTAGKYTLTLGSKSIDLFVIFELPNTNNELNQLALEKFLYDDNPNNLADETAILLGVGRYGPGSSAPPNYRVPSGHEIKEGNAYGYRNQQYSRFILEEYVIPTINGRSGEGEAAGALARRVDRETVFRNPHPRYSSWDVLNPGSNPRQQCSNISALLTAFNRTAGIPARPIMVDWRNNTFDHSTEVWQNGGWVVYRGYNTFEMFDEPNNSPQGCSASIWPACGTSGPASRSGWGGSHGDYKPWHSPPGTNLSWGGNVIVLAEENWSAIGLAYRWASWDIDGIVLHENKLKTQNSIYWRTMGWNREPTNYGPPGWPPAPGNQSATTELQVLDNGQSVAGFQSDGAQLGGVVAERGVDTDGNGRYDQLILEVEVTVSQPGSYWLWGQLGMADPVPALRYAGGVVAETVVQADLVAGTQRVQLVFDGPEIAVNGVAGPYGLTSLRLTNVANPGPAEFMTESLAYLADSYTTAPYQSREFEDYGATLTDRYSHEAEDSNGDGQVDALLVKTEINISEPGNYAVEAALYDGQDQFISAATWRGSGSGVMLRFEDVAGRAGPYTVRDLNLLNGAGESIDYAPVEAYTIEPISDLARPSVAAFSSGEGLTAFSSTITPTNVFNEQLVNGNLQFNAQVTVAAAGTYKIEAWLADTNGNLVTWASGQPTILEPGLGTLSLTFDGRNIRAHGVKGPYTVVAVKILAGNASYQVLDKVNVALTTQPYSLGQFVATGASLFEDFAENGAGQWQVETPWAIEEGVHQYFGPSNAWYANNADASLTLATPLDLTLVSDLAIKFHTSYRFREGEAGYVEASVNDLTWSPILTLTGSSSWSAQPRLVDLSSYVGLAGVRLRFRLAAATNPENDGWYVDDIIVGGMLDSDQDGLSDVDEINNGTDPNEPDTDGDGMPDGWEVDSGFDPLLGDDTGDADGDGLSNGDEYDNGTNPNLPDTDHDGLPDGWEVDNDLDPLIDDTAGDLDNDGLSNEEEYTIGTLANDNDTDNDGLLDGQEVGSNLNTNPLNPDSDGDGINDGIEVGPNPNNPINTDDNGPIDALDPDSDDDTVLDANEWDTTQNDSLVDDLCGNRGLDTDGDGIPNCQDNDVDGDDIPNYQDLDSDGDGKTDETEIGTPGNPTDSDGDYIPDWLDDLDNVPQQPILDLENYLPIIIN